MCYTCYINPPAPPPRRNPPSLTICLEGPKNWNFPPEVHSYLQDFARGVSAYPKKVQLVRKTPTLGGLSATLPETSLIHKPCLPTPSRINSSLFFLGSSPYLLSADFPPSLPQGASLSSSQNHHLGGYPPPCNFLSFLCLLLGSLGSTAPSLVLFAPSPHVPNISVRPGFLMRVCHFPAWSIPRCSTVLCL